MAYRLSRKDQTLTEMLRRVARGEIEAALAQDPGAAGAIHDCRKRVKKLRALLRLVRTGFAGARAENAVLREAAAGLSGLRDAEVMLAVHDRLSPGEETPLVRAHLLRDLERAAADPLQAARTAAFRAALAAMLSRLDGWAVKGREAAVLGAGLARARREGARAVERARATREAEALHDWRKRVKDLWYQARLFAPVWPEMLAPWETAAGALGERLGDHHDLAVLAARLEGLPAPALAQAAVLRARAGLAQGEIEATAFAMGSRLHAGDPEAEAGLWLAWAEAWRRL
jgi:CHAD domain-containing protein